VEHGSGSGSGDLEHTISGDASHDKNGKNTPILGFSRFNEIAKVTKNNYDNSDEFETAHEPVTCPFGSRLLWVEVALLEAPPKYWNIRALYEPMDDIQPSSDNATTAVS
jgi:hypothetical protein